MIPSLGRIVLYALNHSDAETINSRRCVNGLPDVAAGDEFPMVITKVWGPFEGYNINGTVMLDGGDTFWATQCMQDHSDSAVLIDGMWRWPPRV